MGAPRRFVSWLLLRLTLGLVLAGLGLTAVGYWHYWRAPVDFATSERNRKQSLTSEAADLKTAQAGVEARLTSLRIEVAARNERARQAGRVARELEELGSGMNWVTTDSAQLQEYKERMARMREMEAAAKKKAAELEESLIRTQWEKDGLEIALARKQQELADTVVSESAGMHYAREAWASVGWVAGGAGAIVFIAPLFWRSRRTR